MGTNVVILYKLCGCNFTSSTWKYFWDLQSWGDASKYNISYRKKLTHSFALKSLPKITQVEIASLTTEAQLVILLFKYYWINLKIYVQ